MTLKQCLYYSIYVPDSVCSANGTKHFITLHLLHFSHCKLWKVFITIFSYPHKRIIFCLQQTMCIAFYDQES